MSFMDLNSLAFGTTYNLSEVGNKTVQLFGIFRVLIENQNSKMLCM